MNIFILSVCQNFLWDYATLKRNDFVEKEKLGDETVRRMRIMFNLDMLNGIVSISLSFFSPVLAFILLFFKIPLFVFASLYIAAQRRKEMGHKKK